ncbi:hypothetical protein SDC9_103755 [bioreactor metagenome]|uniref:Uncharacterized protein n=1 Tax=bioreactor metagenome TaxID=1076179 RepID=A0A645AVY4_9ZZZZ
MGEVGEETFMLLGRDLGRRAQPDRLLRIERAFFNAGGLVLIGLDIGHHDRIFDEIRIFAHDFGKFPAFEVGFLARFDMKRDRGAGFGARRFFDGVVVIAVGGPAHGRGVAAGAPGFDFNLFRDHEGGVEADAELADQLRRAGGVALLEIFEKRAGAGFGDGADVVAHFIGGHADAVVGDGDGFGVLVDIEVDAPVPEQFFIGQRREARLVDGIGGIGDQFTQKNVGIGVERMNHQIEQLLDLGFECLSFGHFIHNLHE